MADAIIGRVRAVITADTKGLDSGLQRASARLGNFGQSATQVGRTLTTRLTLPIAGVGVAAVKMAADFEKSMASIVGLVGVAAEEVKAMEGSVRSMAKAFGSSATEAGNALFYITSAGLRGADATDTLEASLKAAAIGLGDVSTIADLATSALNAYGSDTLSATQATDVLTAAVREGKLEASQLAGSMGGVLPIASAMGVQFHEVGAAFAALSRTGTNASEAATQINGILSALLKPTMQAEKALRTMGLSSEFLRANIKDKGLLDTLQLLAAEFDGNAAATASVFGNVRALKGVMDLMGANVEGTVAIFGGLEDATGSVDAAFEVISQTAAFQFQQAMAEVKDLLLELGQTIMPTVVGAVRGFADIVSGAAATFSGMSDSTKQIIVTLGGIAAVAGPAMLAVGGLSKAFLALKAANPIVLALSAAVTGIGLVFGSYAGNAREARTRQEALTQAFREAGDPATTVIEKLNGIAASMRDIGLAEPEAQARFEGFMADVLLQSEVTKAGVTSAFETLGADALTAVMHFVDSGTEGFSTLTAGATDADGIMEKIVDTALYGEGPLADFATALYENGEFAEMTYEQMIGLLSAIDNTSKAQADHVKEVNDANKAYLQSETVLRQFANVIGEKAVQGYRAAAEASGDYTAEVLNLYERVQQVSEVHLQDLDRALRNATDQYGALAGSTDEAGGSVNDIARMLVEAGDAAGYDKRKLVELTQQLGILDKLDPSVQVELGLDVAAFDQLIDGLDQFINAQIRLMTVFDDIPAAIASRSPAVQALFDLRNAIREIADAGDDADKKVGGGTSAIDELDKAAEEAAREAERLQQEIDRLAQKIAGLGTELVGRDFFEFMLGASAEDIERRFYDIGQAAMALVEQAEALGLAGGDRFLQTLANIGVEFDRLASLQGRVASTQSEIADVQSRLTTATNDLAAAQARLNDLNAEYLGTRSPTEQLADATNALAQAQQNLNRQNDQYADFLYKAGAGGGTFEDALRTEIETYRDLERELASVGSAQTGFRQSIIDMMSPTVAGAAGAGGVMGNLGNILSQARTFRNNLIELRDRGFPTDVIGQVVAAGMTQGNVISKRLLALGTAEFQDFLALRDEIGRLGVETAAIAGEVIFGADIADAEGAVREQFAIVDRMFQSAIAEAEASQQAQQAIVDAMFRNAIAEAEQAVRVQEETVERLRSTLGALQGRLDSLRENIAALAGDIQTALRTAFDEFLAGLNAAISRLPDTPSLPSPASSGGGGGAGAGRPSAAPSGTPSGPVSAPAPAPSPAPSGYSVQRGDSLWAIAARELGSGTRWREIQAANNISGTLIHPGQMLTIPGRARGGRVSGGRPYLVGEMGPELFVPGESGGILSNRATAQVGSGVVNYNISVTANGDPAEAGRQIVKAIQEYERRNGNRWRSS
jgi:TP901 family phage tail tape measure protein